MLQFLSEGKISMDEKNAEPWFQTSYEFADGTQITLKTNNVGLVKALLEEFAKVVGELDE